MSILAFQKPVFKPAMRIVTAITQASSCLVTTSFDHNYAIGLIVRLDIPPAFGMQQVNQQVGTILTLPTTTTFTLNIDTTQYDSFTTPGTYPADAQSAQVVPVGEVNELLTLAVQNVLPY
jgi:hypothetical protein